MKNMKDFIVTEVVDLKKEFGEIKKRITKFNTENK